MADTIITNSPDRTNDSGAVGLVLALILVVAILTAGYFWYRNGTPGLPNTGDTNINVTVPADGGTGGGTTGGTGGATQ